MEHAPGGGGRGVSCPVARDAGGALSEARLFVAAAPRRAEPYSDGKVANRDIRVWHGATVNGP
jgi:hypothetical protein